MIFLRKCVSLGIVFVLLTAIFIPVNAEDRLDNSQSIIVYGELCRKGLQDLLIKVLTPLADVIGLAEVRVDIKDLDVGKNDRVMLEISARVLEDAYLVGYNLNTPDDPKKYIEEDIQKIFNVKPFEWVFEVPCPASDGPEAFYTPEMQYFLTLAFQKVELYWLHNKETEYMREFSKQFDRYFEPVFIELVYQLIKERRFLIQEIMFAEQFTDHTFQELNIFVYAYAACGGVGKDLFPELHKEVLKGVEDPNRFKVFSAKIMLKEQSKDKIKLEIAHQAEILSSQAIDYFKEVAKGS